METECALCGRILEEIEGVTCPRCGAALCSACFLAQPSCPACGNGI